MQEQVRPVALTFEGAVPWALRGVYFRNGPAKFTLADDSVAHPFDGDGAVCKVEFCDGQATFSARYVQTAGFVAEQRRGERQFRGVFGTNLTGGTLSNALDVSLKNTANTGVLPIGGRLFALMEAAQPYELDPQTLATRAPSATSAFGPAVRPGLPFTMQSDVMHSAVEAALTSVRKLQGRHPEEVKLGGTAVGAHYRRDPATGRTVMFTYQIVVALQRGVPGLQTLLTFLEYDDNMRLHSKRKHTLDGYAFVHDFAITGDHIVLFENDIALELSDFVTGKLCPIHCLKYNEGGDLRVHIVPRALTRGQGLEECEADEHLGPGLDWVESSASAVDEWDARPRSLTVPVDQSEAAQSSDSMARGPAYAQRVGAHGGLLRTRPSPHRRRDGVVTSASAHQPPDTMHVTSTSGAKQCVHSSDTSKALVARLPAEFVEHVANAWSTTDALGRRLLHVLYVGYTSMPDFFAWSGPGSRYQDINPDSQPPSLLKLATLNLSSLSEDPSTSKAAPNGTSCNEGLESASRRVTSRVLEFPSVNPDYVGQQTRYVFGAAALHRSRNRPQQAIAVYDTDTGECSTWSRGWRYYVGEPIMIPAPGHERRHDVHPELDGWLLCINYNAEADESELVILDAAEVSKGPLARAALPVQLPHGLHGAWQPAS